MDEGLCSCRHNETGSGTGRCIDAGWNSGRRRYLDGSRVEKILPVITEITKHPDADKLQVCQVACLDDKTGEEITKQIVTAATNVAVGQVVPVAYHKSRLADGTEIKKGKLRGEVSDGMFCSVAELGIPKDMVMPGEGEGIYILPEGTPIGMDIRDAVMLNDTVYEFELTPNRADCFSMIGLSREFAVLTNAQNTEPTVKVNENGTDVNDMVKIGIDDAELCSRFLARVIGNVKVGPSPLCSRTVCVTAVFAQSIMW